MEWAIFVGYSMRKFIFIFCCLLPTSELFAWSPGVDKILKNDHRLSSDSIVITLRDSGFFYVYTDPSKALEFLEPALDLAEKNHFEQGVADVKGDIGTVNLSIGNHTEAFHSYTEALKIYLELTEKHPNGNFESQVSIMYCNIALVYHHMGNYVKAMAYFTKSLEIDERLHKNDMLAYDYLNIGDTYEKMGIADSARKYTRYALDRTARNRDTTLYALSLLNLGNVFHRFGNADSALTRYHQAIKYASGRNDDYFCEALLGIAKVMFAAHRSDSALYYAKLSLATAIGSTNRMQSLEASNFLCTYYQQNRNSDSLCRYQAYAIAMTDTLFKQKEAQFQNLSEAENIRQRDYEHERIEAAMAHSRQIKMFLVFSILGMFCIALLFSKKVNFGKRKLRPQYLKFLWDIELLLIYEFIILVSESTIGYITHEELYLTFTCQVMIGALLVRLHHYFGNLVNRKFGGASGHH